MEADRFHVRRSHSRATTELRTVAEPTHAGLRLRRVAADTPWRNGAAGCRKGMHERETRANMPAVQQRKGGDPMSSGIIALVVAPERISLDLEQPPHPA